MCKPPTSCARGINGLIIVLHDPDFWELQIYDLKSANQTHPFRTGARKPRNRNHLEMFVAEGGAPRVPSGSGD